MSDLAIRDAITDEESIESRTFKANGIDVEIEPATTLEDAVNKLTENDIPIFDLDGTLVWNLTYIKVLGIESIDQLSPIVVTNRGRGNRITGFFNRKAENRLKNHGVNEIHYKQNRQDRYRFRKSGIFRNSNEFKGVVNSLCKKLGNNLNVRNNIVLIADMGKFNRFFYAALGVNEAYYMSDLHNALVSRGYKNLTFKVIELKPSFKDHLDAFGKRINKLFQEP